jgi:DNA ligase D-like protein (predicted 3'-phosphoesterase)
MSKDSLQRYRAKRDFSRTSEPKGGQKPSGKKPIFVVQKHAARTLHYDFRLQAGGVLKSWAVPKGPSMDSKVRRLAVPTEDHPLDYADFEGVIPAGEYGAGTVQVWDLGTYRNIREEKKDDKADMEQSLDDGRVEVWLQGKKLRGGYALIRTGKKEDKRWLLIKMKDDKVDDGSDITETELKSALSGRTIEEIAKQKGERTKE